VAGLRSTKLHSNAAETGFENLAQSSLMRAYGQKMFLFDAMLGVLNVFASPLASNIFRAALASPILSALELSALRHSHHVSITMGSGPAIVVTSNP